MPNAIAYRTDWMRESTGSDRFPETTDQLLEAFRELKADGHPYGAPAGQSFGDPKTLWNAVLWSYGAKEVAEDGKTPLINSDQTREALEWAQRFWRDCCDESGLSWDDNSNNRFYASEAIGATQNGASIYITAKRDNPQLAGLTSHAPFPKGPRGDQGSVCLTLTHMVMNYSRNLDAAKEFVVWLMEREQYSPWLGVTGGYDAGPLRAYESDPVWNQDPKMRPFLDSAKVTRWVGWPGPPTRATSEADSKFVIVNMFARVFQGRSPRDSMAQAEQELRGIYR
ncbi:MAG: extracellular solute-binding protein [Chloroflexota bacterium]|nr:extracellular solute-binding protein [Chloroflexota bacterium]